MIEHRIEHRMAVRESPGQDPRAGTVVFVHGLGESSLCFVELMTHPDLASWRHLAPDIPGYGRSPWTATPMRLAEQADHLAAWIRERGLAPVNLVGHSMGGVTGLLLCERHPALVTRFINVEGNVSIEDCTFSGKAGALSLDRFVEAGFDSLGERIYRQGLTDRAHRRYYASIRMCDPRQYHLNSRELVEVASAETPAPRMAKLHMPVHYLAGVPGGAGERSRGQVEQAGIPLVTIEGSGHWPFLDNIDTFVCELRTILESDGSHERK